MRNKSLGYMEIFPFSSRIDEVLILNQQSHVCNSKAATSAVLKYLCRRRCVPDKTARGKTSQIAL